MDRMGYKAYLLRLGNQKHYIASISDLVELEKRYGINLDDYIPYDEDYEKVSLLEKALPISIWDDMQLAFAINSYMRYRLDSNYDSGEVTNDCRRSFDECSEYFSFNGTQEELQRELSAFMSEEDSRKFIEGISHYQYSLGEEEHIEKHIFSEFKKPDNLTDSRESDNAINELFFLSQSSHYNINITALTLTTIALLLDIHLTMGIASSALAILGFNSQAIVKVDMTKGETCLILEAVQSANRIIDRKVLSEFNQECVHNDLCCKFQDGEKCLASEDDIETILDELCGKNVFRKLHNLYKYNF